MFETARARWKRHLAGARYTPTPEWSLREREELLGRNGEMEAADRSEAAGVGVRALVGSSWGFAATSDLEAAESAGSRAAAIAHASALVPGPDLHLAEVPAVQDRYVTPVVEDPFAVPLSEKADLVVGVTDTMASVEGIKVAHAYLRFWETEKYLVSSQGHEIHQRLVESGGGMDATAVGETETQRRSYPQSTGDYRTGGYEVVRELRPPRQRRPHRRGGGCPAVGAGLSQRGDGPHPRIEPARPADP